jgi:hypothetical protein
MAMSLGSRTDVVELSKGSYMDILVFKAMLDDYQAVTDNEVVLIIDVSYSGGMLEQLVAPKRGIISSAGDDHSWFDGKTKQNFSQFLIDALFKDVSFKAAFDYATVQQNKLVDFFSIGTTQTPRLEDNGDGVQTNEDGQWLSQLYLGDNPTSSTPIGDFTFFPEKPSAEVAGRITLSVSGTNGTITWGALKGRIEGTGTQVTYVAPDKLGIDLVSVFDESGRAGSVKVTVLPKKRELTIEHVREALAWAKVRGKMDEPLYLFFIGTNGSADKLQLNEFNQIDVTEFKAMLDDYQKVTGNAVVVVIEASHSGSLIQGLAAPNRAIISSTGTGPAYFDTISKLGFIRFLDKGLLRGYNFFEAFNYAHQEQDKWLSRLSETTDIVQNPQMDDDGDGIFTDNDGQWLHNLFPGFASNHAAIIITGGDNNETSTLWSTVKAISNYTYNVFSRGGFSDEEIYYLSPTWFADINGDGIDDQIIDAPSINLTIDAPYIHFTADGIIANTTGYSEDCEEEDCEEVTPITIAKRHAAIFIAGGGSHESNTLWDTTHAISNKLYKVFRNRYFQDEDLYYLSPVSRADFDGDGVDDHIVDAPNPERALTIDDVRQAFAWAKTRGPLDEPLYFFFHGHAGNDSFLLAKTTDLDVLEFKAILDDYQATTGNEIVLLIDACYSGELLKKLIAPKRAIISSTGNGLAYFSNKRGFSRYFAKGLAQGRNFLEAFENAKQLQKKLVGEIQMADPNNYDLVQTPQFDDGQEGRWLSRINLTGNFIVADITLAIEGLTQALILKAGQALPLKARAVLAAGEVKEVWAVIRPPKINLVLDNHGTPILAYPRVKLSPSTEKDIWQGTWDESVYNGKYER